MIWQSQLFWHSSHSLAPPTTRGAKKTLSSTRCRDLGFWGTTFGHSFVGKSTQFLMPCPAEGIVRAVVNELAGCTATKQTVAASGERHPTKCDRKMTSHWMTSTSKCRSPHVFFRHVCMNRASDHAPTPMGRMHVVFRRCGLQKFENFSSLAALVTACV